MNIQEQIQLAIKSKSISKQQIVICKIRKMNIDRRMKTILTFMDRMSLNLKQMSTSKNYDFLLNFIKEI